MNTPGIKKSFVIFLIVKLAFTMLLLLVVVALLFFSSFLFSTYNAKEQTDRMENIRFCDSYYYDRDFSYLYLTLTLHDLYSDEFDKYWEAVDAYQTYTEALEWSEASENGRESADVKLAEALAELSDQESNAKFSETRTTIKWLTEKLNEETGEK